MDGISKTFKGKPLVHSWTYRNADGDALGVVGRYEGEEGKKECVPFFKRNGQGWAAGGASEPRPLYGLDVLTKADANRTALIPEGEKCAAALQSMGFIAVTSPGGSKAAGKADWTPLSGRARVFVLLDNDEAGEGYARDVCVALHALDDPPDVQLVRLPDLPPSGDVVTWLQARREWDGYLPVPSAKAAAEDLQADIRKHAEPMPQDWLSMGEVVALESVTTTSVISFDEYHPPPLPDGLFTGWLGDMIEGVAVSTETPREMAAMMALAVLGTCCQKKFTVRPEPGYFEPTNIWTVPAMDSGNRKSAVLLAMTKPLITWEKELSDGAKSQILGAETDRKTKEARIQSLRGKFAKEKVVDFEQAKRELTALEADLPEIPSLPRLWADDDAGKAWSVDVRP